MANPMKRVSNWQAHPQRAATILQLVCGHSVEISDLERFNNHQNPKDWLKWEIPCEECAEIEARLKAEAEEHSLRAAMESRKATGKWADDTPSMVKPAFESTTAYRSYQEEPADPTAKTYGITMSTPYGSAGAVQAMSQAIQSRAIQSTAYTYQNVQAQKPLTMQDLKQIVNELRAGGVTPSQLGGLQALIDKLSKDKK